MNLEEENKLLKEKISQLIADNMELSSRFECDYDFNKPVRKLTLQEKLEINMGNTLRKFRIPAQKIKNIYYEIMTSEPEPEFIDITFDNDRMYTAFYIVDLKIEKEEIDKGESVELDLEKIPDNLIGVQHTYDMEKVLNKITEGVIINNNEQQQ